MVLLSYKENVLETGSKGEPPGYTSFSIGSAQLWCGEWEAAPGICQKPNWGTYSILICWFLKQAYAIQHICLLDVLWIGVLHVKLLACSLPRKGKEQVRAFQKFFCFLLPSPVSSITLLKYEILVSSMLLRLEKMQKSYKHNTSLFFLHFYGHLWYPKSVTHIHMWDHKLFKRKYIWNVLLRTFITISA